MLVVKSMQFVILIKIKYFQLASHVGCRKNCAAKDDLPTLGRFFPLHKFKWFRDWSWQVVLATCFFLLHMPGLRWSHYYYLGIYINHLQELALHILVLLIDSWSCNINCLISFTSFFLLVSCQLFRGSIYYMTSLT